jgi:dTDP-4-amino-4,6-dideoxygalactose transaminase
MMRLKNVGIGTQVHYLPLHMQPYFRRRYGEMSLPGAEAFYAGVLSLPLHVGMVEADVERVVEALASAVEMQI